MMIQTTVIGKMKHETAGVTTEEFFGMKPKMYSILVEDNSEHTKAKVMNVVAISHKEYKDVQLNNNFSRHSMNKIQSENHKKRTYEINKNSLSCFDNKIYIQNNKYDGLALGYYN